MNEDSGLRGSERCLQGNCGDFAVLGAIVGVPLVFVLILSSGVKLGEPQSASWSQNAAFLFVTNTFYLSIIAFVYSATFLGLCDMENPFKHSVIPALLTFIMEATIFTGLYMINQVFSLVGLIAYGIAIITVTIYLLVIYSELRTNVLLFIFRFLTPIFLFISALSVYAIAFREASSFLEAMLVIAISLCTFIVRRLSLTLLDPFSLEISMLVSGFWIQNLNDILQTLAFPQINNPLVFIAIWSANAFANLSMLFFISDTWIIKIRPQLKNNAVNALTFNFPIPPPPELDFSVNLADRGHGSNVQGYRRRQFRFFSGDCAVKPQR